MKSDYLDLLTKAPAEREAHAVLTTYVRAADKQRAQACADALNISLSAFADRAVQAAILAVEPTLCVHAAVSGE